MTVIQPLPPADQPYELVAMLTPSHAVDLFLGDLQRKSRSKSGRTPGDYARVLDKLVGDIEKTLGDCDVAEITADHVRRHLDKHARLAPGTQATYFSIINSFFKWLYLQDRIRRNPLDRVPRPKRLNPEDLDIVTVSAADVVKMREACTTDAQRIAIAILTGLGPRRNAAALLRLRDYDQVQGLIRFHEKGGKTIWKPVPDELRTVLDSAVARGLYTSPDDYLIPPEGKLQRSGDRDDRVVWRLVRTVADEAGVRAHVHALRHAFATFYIDNYGSDGLQDLLGHASPATTRLYVRKRDKMRSMERVRSLAWGGNMGDALSPQIAGEVKASSLSMGAGGFEPPKPELSDALRPGRLIEGLDDSPVRADA